MLKGHITFSMPNSNIIPERWVEIKIEDVLSGTQFLRVKMSPETFTLATVGSLGYADCEFELYPANVGKVRQHKTEIVPIDPWKSTPAQKDAAVAQFEVDGWKGNIRDTENHHRFGKNGISVSFIRFIEADSEDTDD